MRHEFNIYTDGSGTKGIVGYAAYIEELRKFKTGTQLDGTVNTAEWNGLILGLKLCRRLQKEAGGNFFKIHMDSQLVVRQMNGEYANNKFPEYQREANDLMAKIARDKGRFQIIWIPRERNEIADRAANYARKEMQKAWDNTFKQGHEAGILHRKKMEAARRAGIKLPK